jgi:GNAT superfamily N-acetyltransferase
VTGYTDLPAGAIAAVVTYLEMREAPTRPAPEARPDWSLVPLAGEVPRYRALFRRVGEPWLWFTRLIMTDEALRAVIEHSDVQALALRAGGADIGILELDFRHRDACELAFFGLVPEAVGSGWGRLLMNEALRRAWREPISRLWVHTCSLDHPRALSFYIRSGFRPYKRAVEIADDPRLKGYLPRTAAPHLPIIEAPAQEVRSRPGAALARWAARRRRDA